MSPESLFSICNLSIVPGWFVLVFLPRWKWSARLVSASIIPLLLSAVYLVLVALFLGRSEGGFGSLEQVRLLFAEPYLQLAGWIHYLAFDLFVGSWEVRESQRLKMSHFWVVPCLLLTFLLGPVGLLLFLSLRFALRRRVWVEG